MHWKVFQFIDHVLIILDKAFIGDWEVVTVEQWILRPKLLKLVVSSVHDALSRLRHAALTSPPDNEPVTQSDIKSKINAVRRFLLPLKTWDHMMEDGRLPRHGENGKIRYELDHNVLLVNEVPSLAHDAASRSVIPYILSWSTNGMTTPPTLEMLGGGGISLFRNLILISQNGIIVLAVGNLRTKASVPSISLHC